MIDKTALIEHIKDKDQHLVMRRIIDKLERAVENYSIEYTDFLDPYQRKLSYSFLNKFREVSFFEEGGLVNAERKSIVIYPSFIEKHDIESPIKALRVDGSFKFKELKHRDYLGALMGLGIKREKIGDILIYRSHGNLIVLQELADYIKYNLKVINTEPISISEINVSDLEEPEEDYIESCIIISSFRLDTFVSAICKISREKSASLIKNGKVKLNWKTADALSQEISEDDIISVRGLGRVKVVKNVGKTKKDRKKVIVRIIK